MAGLRGCCSSSTRGSRASNYAQTLASFALLPRVLDEQHPSRPVIIPIMTRNSQIRNIFMEIRAT